MLLSFDIQVNMNATEIYNRSGEYSSKAMFSPPAERLSRVIRFELTQGCPWGKCTYCCGFDGTKFREKGLDVYKRHVDRVFEALSYDARGIYRVFIGGGDALAVETSKLVKAVNYTRESYGSEQNYSPHSTPRRLAIYGSTRSINQKDLQELRSIKQAGVDLVYWGIESGADEILGYVNKGCTGDEVLSAAQKINKAGLNTSVMIMPGLGGFNFYTQHITETAKVLSVLKPMFITFMGINADPKSAYARRMKREKAEGLNRPLTPPETIRQMAEIIRNTKSYQSGARVGCYTPDIDGVGCNPLPFGTFKIKRDWPFLFIESDQEYLSYEIMRRYRELSRRKIAQSKVKPTEYALNRLGSQESIKFEHDQKDSSIFRIQTPPEFLTEAQMLKEELETLYYADVRVKVG